MAPAPGLWVPPAAPGTAQPSPHHPQHPAPKSGCKPQGRAEPAARGLTTKGWAKAGVRHREPGASCAHPSREAQPSFGDGEWRQSPARWAHVGEAALPGTREEWQSPRKATKPWLQCGPPHLSLAVLLLLPWAPRCLLSSSPPAGDPRPPCPARHSVTFLCAVHASRN